MHQIPIIRTTLTSYSANKLLFSFFCSHMKYRRTYWCHHTSYTVLWLHVIIPHIYCRLLRRMLKQKYTFRIQLFLAMHKFSNILIGHKTSSTYEVQTDILMPSYIIYCSLTLFCSNIKLILKLTFFNNTTGDTTINGNLHESVFRLKLMTFCVRSRYLRICALQEKAES
jgi:hypothetical protein